MERDKTIFIKYLTKAVSRYNYIPSQNRGILIKKHLIESILD